MTWIGQSKHCSILLLFPTLTSFQNMLPWLLAFFQDISASSMNACLCSRPKFSTPFLENMLKCHTKSSTSFLYVVRQGLRLALMATRGSTYFSKRRHTYGGTNDAQAWILLSRAIRGGRNCCALMAAYVHGKARMACYVLRCCRKVHSRLPYSFSSYNELLM